MFPKILTVACLILLVLVAAVAIFAVSYENEYQQIMRLSRERDAIPLKVRQAKAKEIAQKVYDTYLHAEYLSFHAECMDYWYHKDSWRDRLPMKWWPSRKHMASVETAMGHGQLKTEIFVRGQPLYTLLLSEGRYWEFKWPYNGVPGQRTAYPVDFRLFRLPRGVDGHLRCSIGTYRSPWIGHPHQPEIFKRFLGSGQWLGIVNRFGCRCDVIFTETGDEEWNRRDAFYVDSTSFVRARYIMLDDTEQAYDFDTYVSSHRYSDLQTNRLPPEIFKPSAALMAQTAGWQELSEAQIIKEIVDVNGPDSFSGQVGSDGYAIVACEQKGGAKEETD